MMTSLIDESVPMEAAAKFILHVLTSHGEQAYLVGGYVRDKVMGKPVHDIDIATSALPDQVIALFPHTIPTGLKHGTVSVRINHRNYEVTTFRKESSYEFHRRPEQVEFVTDLLDDLKRRDFTINAIAMDQDGQLIDPFHGQEDIAASVLRCVGNSVERFHEDALRMMRCVRFAANYQLAIDGDTWHALTQHRELLRYIAMERIGAEFDKIMSGCDPYRGLFILLRSGLLQHTKVALSKKLTQCKAEALPAALQNLSQLTNPQQRWATVFLHLRFTSEEARLFMRSFAMSNLQLNLIQRLVNLSAWLIEKLHSTDSYKEGVVDRISEVWKLASLQFGVTTMQDWLAIALNTPLVKLDFSMAATAAEHSMMENGLKWLAEMPVHCMADLKITGTEVTERIKQPQGPWISAVLQSLLQGAALGIVRNEKDELLAEAEIYYREWHPNG